MSGTDGTLPDFSAAQYEEAATWFMRLRAPAADLDDATIAEFEAWLDRHPDHTVLYEQAAAAWGAVEDHAAVPEMVVARRDALERTRRLVRDRWSPGSGARRFAIAAGIAAIVVAVGMAIGPWSRGAETYETVRNETRVMTLPDGTRMALDAKSRAKVSYEPQSRAVELLEGQAQFEVAKDPTRPFMVKAGGRTVVALGTVFNVELINSQVLVTLIEGHVAVTDLPAGAPVSTRELTAGEQLVMRSGGPAELRRAVNVANTNAWRQGKLVFEEELLSSALARINRYAQAPLIVGDDKAGRVRISGVFNTGDTAAFTEALEQYFGVRVERGGDGAVRLYAGATTAR